MEYKIKGLQPETLFRFFEDISACLLYTSRCV